VCGRQRQQQDAMRKKRQVLSRQELGVEKEGKGAEVVSWFGGMSIRKLLQRNPSQRKKKKDTGEKAEGWFTGAKMKYK